MTTKSDWIDYVVGSINHWRITMRRVRQAIEQVEKDKRAFDEFIRREKERGR